jgi:hypothetical protein
MIKYIITLVVTISSFHLLAWSEQQQKNWQEIKKNEEKTKRQIVVECMNKERILLKDKEQELKSFSASELEKLCKDKGGVSHYQLPN